MAQFGNIWKTELEQPLKSFSLALELPIWSRFFVKDWGHQLGSDCKEAKMGSTADRGENTKWSISAWSDFAGEVGVSNWKVMCRLSEKPAVEEVSWKTLHFYMWIFLKVIKETQSDEKHHSRAKLKQQILLLLAGAEVWTCRVLLYTLNLCSLFGPRASNNCVRRNIHPDKAMDEVDWAAYWQQSQSLAPQKRSWSFSVVDYCWNTVWC